MAVPSRLQQLCTVRKSFRFLSFMLESFLCWYSRDKLPLSFPSLVMDLRWLRECFIDLTVGELYTGKVNLIFSQV